MRTTNIKVAPKSHENWQNDLFIDLFGRYRRHVRVSPRTHAKRFYSPTKTIHYHRPAKQDHYVTNGKKVKEKINDKM